MADIIVSLAVQVPGFPIALHHQEVLAFDVLVGVSLVSIFTMVRLDVLYLYSSRVCRPAEGLFEYMLELILSFIVADISFSLSY